VNRVVDMLVPTKYGMTNPVELMAEMMAMISTGEYSPIGVNINSEIPTFYVPAKRFFKLIDRYGFDK
jgi:hypothetical protein